MTVSDSTFPDMDRCDMPACPRPDDHFPVVQLILPMEMGLAAALMQATADACEQEGLEAILPQGLGDHGNGRLYARKADTLPPGSGPLE
jgi:hypothetical protein